MSNLEKKLKEWITNNIEKVRKGEFIRSKYIKHIDIIKEFTLKELRQMELDMIIYKENEREWGVY